MHFDLIGEFYAFLHIAPVHPEFRSRDGGICTMTKPKKSGRPSEYDKAGGDEKAPDMVRSLALLGATETEMAAAFGVCLKTITNWENKHPLFRQAILDGRLAADAQVGQRLFERALGYEHDEDKIFYDSKEGKSVVVPTTKRYPPDTTAAIFWLKNRRPEDWRDKQEVKNTHDVDGGLAAVLKAVDGKTKSV